MKKYLFVLILLIIMIPTFTKADTWLDDPSYRDTSWFDASTYDSTTRYTINSSEKLAGLLYLVNVENYTFEGKEFLIRGNTGDALIGEFFSCRTDSCFINLSAHDWVPIKKSFKGTFITRDNNGAGYILIFNETEKHYFIEGNVGTDCSVYSNSTYCYRNSVAYYISNLTINNPSHGTLNIYTYYTDNVTFGISRNSYELMVTVEDGYYLDTIEIIDSDNQKTEATLVGENQFRLGMPDGPITINPVIKKVEDTGCKLVSGTGKNIGDEIDCNGERFYVLSNDDTNIKMLAKYNLHTGVSIYKEKIEMEEGDTRNEIQYCDDLAAERNATVKRDAFYNVPGYCFYVVSLPNYKIVQTEDSKSAHWDEDLNYLYPQVGDVYIISNVNGREYNNPTETDRIGDTKFYNFRFNIDTPYAKMSNYNQTKGSGAALFLYLYSQRLKNYGVDLTDISLLQLDELDEIVNKISGNNLPLQEWSDNVQVVQYGTTYTSYVTEVSFGDIKQYIPSQYSWLYSTTYWNGSVYNSTSPRTFGNLYQVFTASQGKVCGAGYEYCAPTTTLGCGLRPVITIPADSLIYEIKTETDDYSDIEVVSTSPAEEEITFKLSIDRGRKLRSITIRTDSNEEITFTEGELINNPDGTISINRNKFTMPFDNVTIIVATDPFLKAEVIKNDNCTITLSKSEELEPNENVIITVDCNEGYEFKNLEVKDENNNVISYISFRNTYSFVMPTTNVTVGGECSLITFNAEIIKEENSNVTISKETEIVPNEEVITSIKCNEGYEFDLLEVVDKDNNKITLTNDNDNYKFNMPSSDVKVSGICKKIEEPVTPDQEEPEPDVPSESESPTPITSDNIMIYVILLIVSVISLLLIVNRKRIFKKK